MVTVKPPMPGSVRTYAKSAASRAVPALGEARGQCPCRGVHDGGLSSQFSLTGCAERIAEQFALVNTAPISEWRMLLLVAMFTAIQGIPLWLSAGHELLQLPMHKDIISSHRSQKKALYHERIQGMVDIAKERRRHALASIAL